MGRSRSRSRSRERDRRRSPDHEQRRRSRSRERTRSKWDSDPAPESTALAAIQAVAAIQQQQALQRQILAAQTQQHQAAMLAQAQAVQQQQQQQAAAAFGALPQAAAPGPTGNDLALDAAPTPTNKKQRELYIGNLATGVVTPEMLRELFNAVLSNMVPDPVATPPVMEVKTDPTGRGRFAFVELRTAALALAALHLDKVELCGRQINIGRPKGYVDPPALEQQAKLSMAQMFAAQVSGGPSNVVLLKNLMPANALLDEDILRELHDDIYMEVVKCGPLSGLALPLPQNAAQASEACRVYVRYTSHEGAVKCKAVMDGREFDGNKVQASLATEQDFYRAQAGEWL